jgi:hypothetical protein
MSVETQINQSQEQKPNDKEYNFRALEAKYKREIEEERAARRQAEGLAEELRKQKHEEPDDDSEPYVDNKKLDKK